MRLLLVRDRNDQRDDQECERRDAPVIPASRTTVDGSNGMPLEEVDVERVWWRIDVPVRPGVLAQRRAEMVPVRAGGDRGEDDEKCWSQQVRAVRFRLRSGSPLNRRRVAVLFSKGRRRGQNRFERLVNDPSPVLATLAGGVWTSRPKGMRTAKPTSALRKAAIAIPNSVSARSEAGASRRVGRRCPSLVAESPCSIAVRSAHSAAAWGAKGSACFHTKGFQPAAKKIARAPKNGPHCRNEACSRSNQALDEFLLRAQG